MTLSRPPIFKTMVLVAACSWMLFCLPSEANAKSPVLDYLQQILEPRIDQMLQSLQRLEENTQRANSFAFRLTTQENTRNVFKIFDGISSGSVKRYTLTIVATKDPTATTTTTVVGRVADPQGTSLAVDVFIKHGWVWDTIPTFAAKEIEVVVTRGADGLGDLDFIVNGFVEHTQKFITPLP